MNGEDGRGPSLLATAGGALVAVVKHVPTRGALWSFGGFVLSLLGVGASIVVGPMTFDRGAMLMAEPPIIVVPFVLPFASAALLGMHGLHRGAARAALEIERKLGLVRHVVDRVFDFLHSRFGSSLSQVPLGELEAALRTGVERYMGSADMDEGRGITGFVLRRAKRAILDKVDDYLLVAYRAEAGPLGAGGGVDLSKVHARVVQEMSARAEDVVSGTLNKQALLFVALVVLVSVFWFHIIMGVLMAIGLAFGGSR